MNLSLVSPINFLGYGHVGVNLVRELSKLCDLSLWHIGPVECEEKNIPYVKQAIDNAKLFSYTAPAIRLYHEHGLDMYPGEGTKIGWPIFELDRFTEIQVHHLKFPDRLFVCSDWAKEVLSQFKYVNTKVIPLGVDMEIFYPAPINPGPTVFYNIGKWEVRKGHDTLIQAFKDEFKQNENVKLLLCCSNPFLTPEQTAQWTNMLGGNKNIHLVPRLKTHKDVADLMRTCDCGVFPARAEGWNMEALETLACGRHLIITNYSAHTQYVDCINSQLIDIEETELAFDNIWGVFRGQGNWAKLGDKQYSQLKQHMRNIHELKQGGKLGLNEDGVNTAQRFTWEMTARKVLENI